MNEFAGIEIDNFAIQLQGAKPKEIGASGYDLVIVDYHSKADVDVMSARPGDDRQIISYMSIGEAEDYRSYWKPAWDSNHPSWIDEENPNWPGNYQVKFWDPNWQSLIFGNKDAYLDKIIKAGFDGVFLDTIDTYAYYGGSNSKAAADMVTFVAKISQYAKSIDPDFKIIAQNSEPLLKNATYLNAIDAVSKESLFYNSGKPNSQQDVNWSLSYLKPAHDVGKTIFNIEYVTGQTAVDAAFNKGADQGFLSYVGPLNLNKLAAPHTAEIGSGVKAAMQEQTTIIVHASGDHYLGAPQMIVSVDGKTIATKTVEAVHANNQWQDFTFKLNLSSGADEVSVAFTNDAYDGAANKDRNLWVDYIEVDGLRLDSTDAVYERSNGSHLPGTDALMSKGALVFDTSETAGIVGTAVDHSDWL